MHAGARQGGALLWSFALATALQSSLAVRSVDVLAMGLSARLACLAVWARAPTPAGGSGGSVVHAVGLLELKGDAVPWAVACHPLDATGLDAMLPVREVRAGCLLGNRTRRAIAEVADWFAGGLRGR